MDCDDKLKHLKTEWNYYLIELLAIKNENK
jgi:hypothetical protein